MISGQAALELMKVIGPITDPTAYGGRAEDAFHLVLPSIPGYGFSGKPTGTDWGPLHIATAWDALLRRLGYARYVARRRHVLILITSDPGVRAFAFTFGS